MQQPDMSQIMKLAQSPAGQKLFSMLQSSRGNELQNVLSKANSGDYEGARQALSAALSSPQAQALIRQLEEQR